jgi:hypothetical protein
MSSEQWYFDLNRKVAVPAHERGPGDNMLGPYPSRADAENWKARVEQRNDEWDGDDEDEDGAGPDERSE